MEIINEEKVESINTEELVNEYKKLQNEIAENTKRSKEIASKLHRHVFDILKKSKIFDNQKIKLQLTNVNSEIWIRFDDCLLEKIKEICHYCCLEDSMEIIRPESVMAQVIAQAYSNRIASPFMQLDEIIKFAKFWGVGIDWESFRKDGEDEEKMYQWAMKEE